MLLLAAAAAGCGSSRPIPHGILGGSAIEPSVHFRGASVTGSVYVVAGPAAANGRHILYPGDVYLIRGAPADARRLTDSLANSGGIESVTADGRDVMVTGRHGEVKQLLVGPTTAAWGPNLGTGLLPTMGAGGRYLFVEFNCGRACGAEGFLIRAGRIGHRRQRVAVRARAPSSNADASVAAWEPGGEIALLLGRRVILDAGTSRAHELGGLRHFPFSAGSYLVGGGPHGMLALSGPREIALLTPGGRMRVIRTSAAPDSFSPDGRNLLVTDFPSVGGPSQLSLISTTTGAITPLISTDGHIDWAAWGGGGG